MAYQLILCDLGGVVVDVESDRLIHHVATLLGRSFEDVQAAVYHRDLLGPFELGRIRPQAYYEGLKVRLPLPWTYEQFVRAWNDVFRENGEVTEIMQRLRGRHRLIALSNTNELHLAYIKTMMPSLAVFDDWVASCEVGLRKPDPDIYHLALQRAGLNPTAAVYIDDRPELVEAGRGVGLTSIRFENSRQLEEELRAIGVNMSG